MQFFVTAWTQLLELQELSNDGTSLVLNTKINITQTTNIPDTE